MLAYVDGAHVAVNRVAWRRANLQMWAPSDFRDNHLLTTGIERHVDVPSDPEAVSNSWKNLCKVRMAIA